MDDNNKTKDHLIEELHQLRLKVEEMKELREKFDRTEKMMRDAIVRAHDEKEKNEAIIGSLGDGISIQDLNTSDTAKLAPSMISRIIAGETMKTELLHRRKDGTVFSLEVTAVLMEVEGHKYILGFDRDITNRKTAEQEKEMLISHLRSALAGLKRLRGLLPMCAWCKKVRDDQGYWKQVEKYIEENSEASFTHGICPECLDQVKKEESLT